jgi:hypothetical protein
MDRLNNALRLLASCLIYSLVIALVDFLVVLVFTRELSQLSYWVSFVLLIEGGLGLALGGIVASYSPVVSKFGEMVFRSEPWSKVRQKEAEKQGQILIVAGFFMLLTGLTVSGI